MGVSELWSILEPARQCVSLYSLAGKTLAVDLSLWVCEAQCVKEMMGRVNKPYLRNLFFRISSLTLMGIKLIFVLEGEAPKLKAETMGKRNDSRFGCSKESAPKRTNTSRSRFKCILKECAEMLDCLGVPWLTAKGEAEAMCAFLDYTGLVDGCITNDGDVFLYGAQTVYRNFNMNTKDPQVDCYKMQRVQSELHMERETLVGLAILLGCDYIPKGIPGVGKELALKLIHNLQGQTLLQKFRRWKDEGQEVLKKAVKKVTHCHICRHPGTAKTHEHSGCSVCGSKRFCEPHDYDYLCPCEWHQFEHARQNSLVESHVKRKTLASDAFPFTEIINEFLVPKDGPVGKVTRRKPNMQSMQVFALNKMDWPKHYSSEKVLVLLAYTEMMNIKFGKKNSAQLQPIRIHKTRTRNGVPSFEVIWKKPDHYVHADEHPPQNMDVVTTVEEESLVRSAYPHIVERFFQQKREAEENKLKQKKRPKKGKEKKQEESEVLHLFSRMSLHDSSGDAVEPVGTETVNIKQVKCNKPQSEQTTAGCSSISTIIHDLHLSNIDWDAQSFTSSPSPPDLSPNTKAPSLRKRVLLKSTSEVQNLTNPGAKTLPLTSLRLIPYKPLDVQPVKPSDINNPSASARNPQPAPKYTFVKKKNCTLLSEYRSCEERKPQMVKKSVFISVCSSSEDSDTENIPKTSPRKPAKSKSKPRCVYGNDTKHRSVSQSNRETSKDTEPPQAVDKESCIHSPLPSDGDDSVISVDSPLPLAERLKLRFA